MRAWLTQNKKFVIGMVHLAKMRGVSDEDFKNVIARAEADYWSLVRGGIDAVCIINEGDMPWRITVTAQELAALHKVVTHIRALGPVPLGACVLYNDWRATLQLAATHNLEFVRIDTFVDTNDSDAGIIYPEAEQIVAMRNSLAPQCLLFTDIQVKHKHALDGQPLSWSATQAFAQGSDGVIVTGLETGVPPTVAAVQELCAQFPSQVILTGSGMDPQNGAAFFAHINGAFVGTALKEGGVVNQKKVVQFMDVVHGK